jgi:NADH-quinone oxidoreductase E subunit
MRVTTRPEPQTGGFDLSAEHRAQAEKIKARYPEDRVASAIIPLLDIAQRENGGFLSKEAIDFVAQETNSAPIRVYEVASFYTMFNLNPVGKHLIQVCRTTPCWLRGSDELTNHCKSKLGIEKGETTADGEFTLLEVECLGACCNAPMVQINDDYFEDLTPELLDKVLDDLKAGNEVSIGSQQGRQGSSPEGDPQTLFDVKG